MHNVNDRNEFTVTETKWHQLLVASPVEEELFFISLSFSDRRQDLNLMYRCSQRWLAEQLDDSTTPTLRQFWRAWAVRGCGLMRSSFDSWNLQHSILPTTTRWVSVVSWTVWLCLIFSTPITRDPFLKLKFYFILISTNPETTTWSTSMVFEASTSSGWNTRLLRALRMSKQSSRHRATLQSTRQKLRTGWRRARRTREQQWGDITPARRAVLLCDSIRTLALPAQTNKRQFVLFVCCLFFCNALLYNKIINATVMLYYCICKINTLKLIFF